MAETTPSQWEAAQARLGGGVLHATQAFLSLQSAGISRGARLWFATRGAQAVLSDGNSDASSCQPLQALVWGLARQISLEYPGHFGAIIDLDFETSPLASAAAIWHEIENVAAEDAVAYRGGRRLVPRLVRAAEPQSDPLMLRGDGSYLITGGLGGLGLQIANWMAARGAGHIVLLSRRDFPERSLWGELPFENTYYETVRSVLSAEELGARITVAQADVADEKVMRSLFKRFGKEDPPLRGIVHAAVDMTSRSISNLNLELFQKMCHAKALGGWILHQLTSRYGTGFLRLVFFHDGVVGGGRPRALRRGKPGTRPAWHDGGASMGFPRCLSTGELGKRCASRAKRTRSNLRSQVSTLCLTHRRCRQWNASSRRIEFQLSWHQSTGMYYVLSTKRAEPGLFLLKCDPALGPRTNQLLPGNPPPRTRRSAFS